MAWESVDAFRKGYGPGRCCAHDWSAAVCTEPRPPPPPPPQGICPAGFYQAVDDPYYWACGVGCPGGSYTDMNCRCACQCASGFPTDLLGTNYGQGPWVAADCTAAPPPTTPPPPRSPLAGVAILREGPGTCAPGHSTTHFQPAEFHRWDGGNPINRCADNPLTAQECADTCADLGPGTCNGLGLLAAGCPNTSPPGTTECNIQTTPYCDTNAEWNWYSYTHAASPLPPPSPPWAPSRRAGPGVFTDSAALRRRSTT